MATSEPPGEFSHLDRAGHARMVDVGEKQISARRAVASGRITMSSATLERLRDGQLPKGDVLAVARIAAIQAAKETARWIPLCHPLPLDGVDVDCRVAPPDAVEVLVTVRVTARTGVEMEALTAVSAALLVIYDMCKALDRGMVIGPVQLERKEGGRSGDWSR